MTTTGSVEPFKRADGTTYYRARIRLADDSRVRVDVPPKYSTPAGGKTARERAELYAAAAQEREDDTGELLAKKRAKVEAVTVKIAAGRAETCDRYFERVCKQREAEGKRDVGHERSAWGRWVSPLLGRKPIATVPRDDVEAVRDALDVQVRERISKGQAFGISGKTAMNAWSVLRIVFKESVNAREKSMRVRTIDPSHGIKAPLKTRARTKTFLYPAEAAKLLACEAVPREWRELYAVALYTYLRPNELRALLWSDVDLDARVVHVTKAYDEKRKIIGPPKTKNAVRDVPIEAELVPLLERLKPKSGAPLVAPLLVTCNEQHRAKMLRTHLELADVRRSRLTESTAMVLPINFRSCRDSGITWLALSGLDVAKIMRRCGHDDVSTTLGYVKMAEDLTGAAGVPFAPLPSSPRWAKSRPSDRSDPKKAVESVPEEGVEPSPPAGFTADPDEPTSSEPARVDSSARHEAPARPSNADPDEALRAAVVAALYAGDLPRVKALVAVLEATPAKRAAVLEIVRRRG